MTNALLFTHILKTYTKIVSVTYKVFGFKKWFIYFYFFKIPIKILCVQFLLGLDHLFFPKFRNEKIDKPIFIIGHPRSGTSFFQRILASSDRHMTFENWEIYNPSLISKKIVSSFKIMKIVSSFVLDFRYTPHLIKEKIQRGEKSIKERVSFYGGNASLQGSKEEEFLFLNILDTQFLAVETPIGFADDGFDELCFCDEQPHHEKSVLFFKRCLQRQSYNTGKNQIISKLNFSLFRVKTLLKFFPDAKFIFLVRSPLETISSHLSAQRLALECQYGLKNIPSTNLINFYDNRYRYNIAFYKLFVELIESDTIPQEQMVIVQYNEIKNNFKETVEKVKRFTGGQFSSGFDNAVSKVDKKQASYKRSHINLPLEEFGLNEQKIRHDFDFYFEKFD